MWRREGRARWAGNLWRQRTEKDTRKSREAADGWVGQASKRLCGL